MSAYLLIKSWGMINKREGVVFRHVLPIRKAIAVHRDAVPGREGKEVVAMDAVLASGEPESGQVAFFNPPQYGHLADAALPGDGPGGEVDRVGFFCFRFQFSAS
jgi:hypothetical protein